MNYKEGFWRRNSFLQALRDMRERLRIQEEQRLQNIRNWFLQRERERQRKRLEEEQVRRRLEAERLERERIQAILDEQRRLRLIEEQKELDRISREEKQGILTSYLSY
jgi:adenylate kinase family enzyme